VALLYKPWNSVAIFSADLKPARVDMNSNIFFFEYIRSSKRIARLSGWVLLLRALPCAWILQREAQVHDIRTSSYRITNSDITQCLHCYLYIYYTWQCNISHSCDRASLMYSFKYNQQDARLYNILYYCQCSTCFRPFLRPSSELKTVHTAFGTWQTCLLVPLASKFVMYQMLCVQFWAPDDGRRNSLKHVEHWQ